MRRVSEAEALARLRRGKESFQTDLKLRFEHRAQDCRACPTPGACCTDAHFVNVHITRLEAVAVRDTLERTPRLDDAERRAVYERARATVERYGLRASGDTFAQTYSCPLYVRDRGCLVHRRVKPAPCVHHACYEDWADVPPPEIQWREERRIEQLNAEAYGAAWAWLPLPVWLVLLDPAGDGAELSRLAREWEARGDAARGGPARDGKAGASPRTWRPRRPLPVLSR
ncbi:MAG TPA: hypothetical protein VEY09_16430 [Pyrinomonadaceae bacterium]|nr:hypothetical protein [Pyrinomonadaceae bacterium]